MCEEVSGLVARKIRTTVALHQCWMISCLASTRQDLRKGGTLKCHQIARAVVAFPTMSQAAGLEAFES